MRYVAVARDLAAILRDLLLSLILVVVIIVGAGAAKRLADAAAPRQQPPAPAATRIDGCADPDVTYGVDGTRCPRR